VLLFESARLHSLTRTTLASAIEAIRPSPELASIGESHTRPQPRMASQTRTATQNRAKMANQGKMPAVIFIFRTIRTNDLPHVAPFYAMHPAHARHLPMSQTRAMLHQHYFAIVE
jgi:hypothetical protein